MQVAQIERLNRHISLKMDQKGWAYNESQVQLFVEIQDFRRFKGFNSTVLHRKARNTFF